MSFSVNVALNVQQGAEIVASERAKRRHARPLELDSDDDGKGENDTIQNHDLIPEQVEVAVPLIGDPQIVVNYGDITRKYQMLIL